ncbi:MAG: glycosyltransferase [Candidatus Saccharimonadales bacterium]
MLISSILLVVFGITSALYIIHVGFYLVGASLYDAWQYHRRHQLLPVSLQRYTPTVTLLMPAHNEELVVARGLDSVFASQYTNLHVIVVNDASTDATAAILRRYKRLHPHYSLRIINKRRNGGKGAALNDALRRYVDSELVMMLDADSVLSPDAIKHAVSYFTDPLVAGVAANVQIMNQHTPLSILQKLEHMISYRSKKAYSLTNCDFVIGGVASTYRTSIIRSVGFYDTDTLTEDISLSMKIVALGNRMHRIVYGADVAAITEPVESFKALFRQRFRWKYGSLQNIIKHKNLLDNNDPRYTPMLTMYRLPMAIITEIALLLLPVVWFYAVYISINEQTILLIAGAYATIAFYTLLTIWYDERLRWQERLRLSSYVPFAYFIYYIMDVIQIAAIAKCLFKTNNLLHRTDAQSTWISPIRIGGDMAVQSL